MSGFVAGVRNRSSKSDHHSSQCYQGLEQWNCETGQNHRRFGGVEPGTLFLAFLGRWAEIDRALFWGHLLGGNGRCPVRQKRRLVFRLGELAGYVTRQELVGSNAVATMLQQDCRAPARVILETGRGYPPQRPAGARGSWAVRQTLP